MRMRELYLKCYKFDENVISKSPIYCNITPIQQMESKAFIWPGGQSETCLSNEFIQNTCTINTLSQLGVWISDIILIRNFALVQYFEHYPDD